MSNNTEILTGLTFGSTKPKEFRTPVVEFGLKLKNGQTMNIQANVVPKITGLIQRAPINCKRFEPLLKEHQLAHSLPSELEVSTVELLIGHDYYSELILPERKKLSPGLYFLGSHLGWILSGRSSVNSTRTISSSWGWDSLSLWVRRWLVRPICARKVLVQCEQGMVAAVGDLKTLLFLSCLRCSTAAILLASWDFAALQTDAKGFQ